MQKTFRIGEQCVGGILKIKTNSKNKSATIKKVFSVEVIDWDSEKVIKHYYIYDIPSLQDLLEQLTTYYYSSKIVNHFTHDKQSI